MSEREDPGFVATIGGAPPLDAPTAVLAPTAVAPPLPRAAPRRPRRGRRVMSRVLLVAITAAAALYAAGIGGQLFGMLREGASARAVPAEGGSLLRAVALEAALQGLPEGGQLESLRVTAERLDARVVLAGRMRLVRVTAEGFVTDLPAPEAPTGRTVRLDARAPARLIRTVTRRTGRGARRVSHLTLEGARWQLVFGDGAQFSADARGRDVRRG
jgi:hypothetical protein